MDDHVTALYTPSKWRLYGQKVRDTAKNCTIHGSDKLKLKLVYCFEAGLRNSIQNYNFYLGLTIYRVVSQCLPHQ